MNTKTKRILSVSLLLACVLVFFICTRLFARSDRPEGFGSFDSTGTYSSSGTFSRTGFYFDTVIEITLYDTGDLSKDKADEALNECMSLCAHYEDLFSRTKDGSDIYRINHAEGSPVSVDPETALLLSDAISIAEETEGLVDPSIGALSFLWFPGSLDPSVPSESAIKEALSHVDYRKILIENNTVTASDPDAVLDLGFIAKGYIADRLKEYLSEIGIKSALINLGGNVLALGNKPDGKEFKVGIRDPIHPDGAPVKDLSVSDLSVVSSGNYERFFTEDGIRYHHLLDPFSGYPAETGLSQVTIIASSSEEADALATICFLMGYEKAASFLKEKHPEVRAVFLDEKGRELSPPP